MPGIPVGLAHQLAKITGSRGKIAGRKVFVERLIQFHPGKTVKVSLEAILCLSLAGSDLIHEGIDAL